MSLQNLRQESEAQIGIEGLCEARVPIPRETDTLYRRAAQHVGRHIKNLEIPAQLLMGAVLSAASEADLVLGFLHQNLEVVSPSTSSVQLLMDELLTIKEGRQELSGFGELKREKRGPDGKTKLERFIAANPDIFQHVQTLPAVEKDQLVMQLILLRHESQNALPKYLQTLALKEPQKIAQLRAGVAQYQKRAAAVPKVSNKMSP